MKDLCSVRPSKVSADGLAVFIGAMGIVSLKRRHLQDEPNQANLDLRSGATWNRNGQGRFERLGAIT